MKYKFFGQPNMMVKERKKKYFNGEIMYKPLFRFDEKGEYITDNEQLIEKLKSRFEHTEFESNAPGDKPTEDKKILKCKKCDFETDNQGTLMHHYKEHKKEG